MRMSYPAVREGQVLNMAFAGLPQGVGTAVTLLEALGTIPFCPNPCRGHLLSLACVPFQQLQSQPLDSPVLLLPL